MTTFNQKLASVSDVDFKVILASGVRKSTIFDIDCQSLIYFPFGMVKEDLPQMLTQGRNVELVCAMMAHKGKIITPAEVDDLNPNDVLAFILWVKDQLEAIADLESKYLVSEPDPLLMQAGSQELDQLGIFNVIDNLAMGKIWRHDTVRKLPYHVCFDKQRKSIIEGKVSKRYSQLMIEKNKKR